MIRCKDVSFAYVANKPVLQQINLHLEPGSFTFITGPSGAGKSSLLSLMSLTHKPSRGTLHMFGEDVTTLHHSELPHFRRKIGTVFQDYELLDHMSVADNVGLPLKVQGESNTSIAQKVDELLDWVGLSAFRDIKPPHLSGGQKQRVSIARAVINHPPLIIADEPTGNLDPELSMRIMYLFTSLNKVGTTVIFATHDEKLMEKFEYPTLFMRDGLLGRTRRP